jgi:hypothetical protein
MESTNLLDIFKKLKEYEEYCKTIQENDPRREKKIKNIFGISKKSKNEACQKICIIRRNYINNNH